MRIQQLDLWNFKAFERFTMTLGANAFLVGPNNAGKSTLIGAAGVAAGMLEHASRRRATGFRPHGERVVRTHSLRADQYGLVTENLRHQFRSAESAVSIRTDTDLILTGVWPSDDDDNSEPFFYLRRPDERSVSEPSKVRELTGQIGVVPGLYPMNHTETVLDARYVRANFQRRRSSQHARNQLLLIKDDDEFEDFNEFLTSWLPEIEELSVTTRSGRELGDREIDVLVQQRGDRTLKELFWVGDGMQILVQILTHLWRLRSADVVILDEPDLYLHADLQRRLVRLLDSTTAQTITATHSSEMLAEASSESVVWVDKSRRRAVRRPKPASLEDLSTPDRLELQPCGSQRPSVPEPWSLWKGTTCPSSGSWRRPLVPMTWPGSTTVQLLRSRASATGSGSSPSSGSSQTSSMVQLMYMCCWIATIEAMRTLARCARLLKQSASTPTSGSGRSLRTIYLTRQHWHACQTRRRVTSCPSWS